jgi:hypothetical protein
MRFAYILVMRRLAALLLAGCATSNAASRQETTATTALTIGAPGVEANVMVVVSGTQRSDVLPTRCGEPDAALRGGEDNVAVVEVKNPNDAAAAVSLSLDGPSINSALVAYATAGPPASVQDAIGCLQIAETTFDLDSKPIQPALSAGKNRGLVVPARGSVFVLVATGDATGAFTLKSVTDALAPPTASLTLAGAPGGRVEGAVFVGGNARAAVALPTRCSEELSTVRPGKDNVAFVEVRNPNDTAASVSLSFDGPETSSALYAFGSSVLPASVRDAERCFQTSATVLDVNGKPIQPSLSTVAGRSLVVPGHGSVFVLVATGSATGAYALHAVTDALAPADTTSITVAPAAGGVVTKTALVSGFQRAGTIPRRCGEGAPARAGADNFAFVEVKNPGDGPASVSLTIDGPDGNNGLFAYASPTPPATLHDAWQCLSSDESSLVTVPKPHMVQPELSAPKGKSVVVPSRGSVFVLLATAAGTGAFTFHASTDALTR